LQSTVKAYGKILVFGAYAILEPGNIGLVVNIDKGTTTTVKETQTGRMVVDLDDFEISIYTKVGEKLKLRKPEDTVFVKNAIEYSFRYLQHKNIKISDIHVINFNDPEFYSKKKLKTGLGSSATCTVSTVASVLNMHGINNKDAVYKIAQYSHYISQGNVGSGFDISAACFGSHFFNSGKINMPEDFIKYLNSEDNIEKESFNWPHMLMPILVFTGKSASTPELVKKVLEFKNNNQVEYSRFMKNYNEINLDLKNAFDQMDPDNIKAHLEKSWSLRKHLGALANAPIEDDKITRLITEMKFNGAFTAGLLGAGGGDSIMAICLSEEDKLNLSNFLRKKHLQVIDNVELVNMPYDIN